MNQPNYPSGRIQGQYDAYANVNDSIMYSTTNNKAYNNFSNDTYHKQDLRDLDKRAFDANEYFVELKSIESGDRKLQAYLEEGWNILDTWYNVEENRKFIADFLITHSLNHIYQVQTGSLMRADFSSDPNKLGPLNIDEKNTRNSGHRLLYKTNRNQLRKNTGSHAGVEGYQYNTGGGPTRHGEENIVQGKTSPSKDAVP